MELRAAGSLVGVRACSAKTAPAATSRVGAPRRVVGRCLAAVRAAGRASALVPAGGWGTVMWPLGGGGSGRIVAVAKLRAGVPILVVVCCLTENFVAGW